MIHKLLFGSRSIALLRGGLDAGAARMRAVSENIANINSKVIDHSRTMHVFRTSSARPRQRPTPLGKVHR